MQNPAACASETVLEKEKKAREVIEACRTDRGFNASTQHYHQLWLRDLVYSEDTLLRLGYHKDVENHLSEFIKLQRSSGQMPTVIDYSASKFIRQRYQCCPSDTEILFIIGMHKYAAIAGNKFLEENKEAVKSCVCIPREQTGCTSAYPRHGLEGCNASLHRQVPSCKPDASS